MLTSGGRERAAKSPDYLGAEVLELSPGQGVSRWLALIWIAIVFLLVRIATHGEFTWGEFASAYSQDTGQLTLLTLAAAGSLLFAWRALRTGQAQRDAWAVGWSVVMAIVGGALWLLGHGSAPVIVALAALGGFLAQFSLRVRSRG